MRTSHPPASIPLIRCIYFSGILANIVISYGLIFNVFF
jgi:hypothetical protein